MTTLFEAIFDIHLFFTLFMAGVIWFVQLVHYPLFKQVAPNNFVHYEQVHTQKTGVLVAPAMLIELGTALALVYFSNDVLWLWLNLILLLIIWGSTFFIQVPLHGKLSQQHDPKSINSLIKSNWIRTILWTIRPILLLYLNPS